MSIIADLSTGKGKSISEKYKTDQINWPSYEKVDPSKKKEPDYCMQVAKAGFSSLIGDRTVYPSDAYNKCEILRSYGQGSQNPAYYLNKIKNQSVSNSSSNDSSLQSSNADSRRKGTNGLNPQVVSIAVNLKNAMRGMIENYEEDIFVDAIDNESGAEENRAMFEAIFDTELKPFTKAVESQYGIPLSSSQNLPEDVSVEEIIEYKNTGGFKTFWAESMEEIIRHTEIVSNWDRTIKRKFIDDGFDLNFMAARCYFDHSSNKEKWDYVDPANFCIQYSNDRLFGDSEYAGYFTLEKIGTLVSYGFDSKKLIDAAKKYDYMFDNPALDWNQYKWTDSYDNKIFDFKIPVFHFSWIDVDVKRQVKFTNHRGKVSINDIGFDEEIKPVDEKGQSMGISRESMNTRRKRSYQCSWVVDTDMCYDYGLVPNQTLKGKGVATLPFFAWRGVTTNKTMVFGSIIESIVPFLDHLQLAWLKYQDALAKAHPGGYAINLRLLQNLKMGSKKVDPLDAYEMFWETGRFPYMDTPIGENYKGGAVMPITRIEGTEGVLMQVFEREIQFVSAMIEKLTGITTVSMGALPDKDTPVATQQMASAGTNNVIRPIINGIFDVKRMLAEQTSKRIPILFKNIKSTVKEYSRVVGDDSVDVVMNAYRNGAEYGLTLEARPDVEAKQRLFEMVDIALARGRDGEASIDLDQAMYIKERIEAGGNLKKLQRQVAFDIRKAKEEQFAKQQQLIKTQSEQQTAQKQAAQQGEMQMKQVDHQQNIELEKVKTENEAYLEQLKANLEYEKDIRDRRSELIAQSQKEQTLI